VNVISREPNTEYSGAASFRGEESGASLEAALPWATLFPGLDDGAIPAGAEIGLVAVVVSSRDHQGGSDCAPNNALGMPQDPGDDAVMDNFAVFRLDRDGDGMPDLGVSPASREGDALSDLAPLRFGSPPDAPVEPLEIIRLETRRAAFSPNGDGIEDEAEVAFTLSASGDVTITVHDATGEMLRTLRLEEPYPGKAPQTITWDGRDDHGQRQEAGVYYLRIRAGLSESAVVPLALLR
jgi:hypothetical protein